MNKAKFDFKQKTELIEEFEYLHDRDLEFEVISPNQIKLKTEEYTEKIGSIIITTKEPINESYAIYDFTNDHTCFHLKFMDSGDIKKDLNGFIFEVVHIYFNIFDLVIVGSTKTVTRHYDKDYCIELKTVSSIEFEYKD